ncbi:MAG: orotate phosphoribosyltransferase [Clostridia bacterium]
MTEHEVLEILKETGALLSGHFLLSSGRHSDSYCQCARLLRFPDKASAVLSRVADAVRDLRITKICGPALGAMLVSYEMGRLLGVESIFTERNKDGIMELRRGFTVNADDRILLVEDAITTGKSTMETAEVLKSFGGEIVAVGCIADRTTKDAVLPAKLYSAVRLNFMTYEADACPLCKTEGAPVKPGSRK